MIKLPYLELRPLMMKRFKTHTCVDEANNLIFTRKKQNKNRERERL